MAPVEVGAPNASGSEGAPAPEEAAGEQLRESPSRKHVDSLLDISEEELLKDLEPQEDPCYGGWDEAVRGWTRAAPLSCILVTQKDHKKPKQKDSVDPPNAEALASDNTPDQLHQHVGSRLHAGSGGSLQSEASRRSGRAEQKSPAQRPQGENTQDLREAPGEIRPTKPQKPGHTSNTAVPIRHFTFLPPIVSPQLLGGGGKSAEGRGVVVVQKGRMRGSSVGAPAGLRQNQPRLLSAISASGQYSLGTAGASQRTAAACSRLSAGHKAIRFGGAAPRIPAMNGSKAACAVHL